MTTLADRMAALRAQIPEPVITGEMSRAERRAEIDRWHAACEARDARIDEEHFLMGTGRSAAVCMTHEFILDWKIATADRWYRALPERYMTPDKMTRPDWDHSHYPHDENGHMGRRVTTRQRPETEQDRRQTAMVRKILANLDADEDI